MMPARDSVERIRRHEVSRALKKTNLSPEDKEVIDLFSRSLVGKLLDGPISEVLARAEAEFPLRSRSGAEASCGLKGHGSGRNRPGQRPTKVSAGMDRATSSSRSEATGSPASLHDPLQTGGIGDRSISIT